MSESRVVPYLNDDDPSLDVYFHPPDASAWHDALDSAHLVQKLPAPHDALQISVGRPPGSVAETPDTVMAATWPRDMAWTGPDVRALAAWGGASQVAAQVRADLTAGARSVWLAPSEPACLVTNAADLAEAWADVDPSQTPMHLDPSTQLAHWRSAFLAQPSLQDIPRAHITGAIPASTMAALAQQGFQRASWFDEVAAHVQQLADTSLDAVGIDGEVVAAQGAGVILESGLVLAALVETMRALTARGIQPDHIAAHTIVRVSVGSDILLYLARLRALRVALSRMLIACGVSDARAFVRIHAVGHRGELSQMEPWTNVLRGTGAAVAAMLGGADVLTLIPRDAASGMPTPAACRLAVTTPWVLHHEAHLLQDVDPADGSFVIEQLTADIARASWDKMRQIERAGGLCAWVEAGALKAEIADDRARVEVATATRQRTLLGVNRFVAADIDLSVGHEDPSVFRISSRWEQLRGRASALSQGKGRPFIAALLVQGPVKSYRRSADFARDILALIGCESVEIDVDKMTEPAAVDADYLVWCQASLPSSETLDSITALWTSCPLLWVGQPPQTQLPARFSRHTPAIAAGGDVLAWLTARLDEITAQSL